MKRQKQRSEGRPLSQRNSSVRRRSPSPLPQTVIFLIFVLIASLCYSALSAKPNLLGRDSAETAAELQNPAVGAAGDNELALRDGTAQEITENISSTNAILINLTTGRTVCEKNSEAVSYPASLTKIMSAIIAIENIPNPDETMITVTEELVERLTEENSSMAGFSGGETLSATSLLNGCLLASGGEATLTLANYVAGSEEAFVGLMNAKATELGCADTHFVNATGLHNLKHTSTVKDISTIFAYALKNDTFRTILTSAKFYSAPTEQHKNGLTLTSTVYAAFTSAGLDMGYIAGGKTGFTPEARQCLASYYVKGDNKYTLVTFGAGDGTNTTYDNAKDAATIYNSYIK